MKRLDKSIMAVVISAVCAPAFADLQGTDKLAADAYFLAHPEIATHASWILENTYRAATLQEANNQLSGNHPWNQETHQLMNLEFIKPLSADSSAAPAKSIAKTYFADNENPGNSGSDVDKTPLTNPELAGSKPAASNSEIPAASFSPLIQANIERTASQKAALKAAQVNHFHQLQAEQGRALLQANIDRTASQHADPVAVQSSRDTLQDSVIAKTEQNAAWTNTKVADAHHAIMVAQIDIDANKAAIDSTRQAVTTNTQRIDTHALSITSLQDDVKNVQRDTSAVQTTADRAEHLATTNSQTIQANASAQTLKDSAQDSALHHAQRNADSALHTLQQQSTFIKQNQDNITANKQDITLTQSSLTSMKTSLNQVSAQLSSSTVKTDNNTRAIQSNAMAINENATAITNTSAAAEGTAKQIAMINSDRVQGMLHAKQQAETQATVKTAIDAIPTPKPDAGQAKEIAINHNTVAATEDKVTQLAKQQQVQSAYYGTQIKTLATSQQRETGVVNADHAALRSTQSQVASNTQQLNKLNSNFSNLKSQVNENKKQASAGVSGAMAMSNIPQVLQTQSFAVGAGVGGYDGESAVAVGFSARLSQRITMKATVSDDTASNIGYGAGMSIGW